MLRLRVINGGGPIACGGGTDGDVLVIGARSGHDSGGSTMCAAAAAAMAVGLLPRPSVSSHSRGRKLLFLFSNDG